MKNGTSKLEVDKNRKCVECRQTGSTPCGLCLTCASHIIDGGVAHTVSGAIVASTIRRRITKMFGQTHRG